MRLLQLQPNGEIHLTQRFLDPAKIPPYAILSHVWGAADQEVTFDDLTEKKGQHKEGYAKIRFCGEQAAKDGLQHFWVDSCCIKKTSDEELSTAIRSMFRWYQAATKCYVYLADVASNKKQKRGGVTDSWKDALQDSRWFKRGWTLQELLAPTLVDFFSRDGKRIGDRDSLKNELHGITGIPVEALQGKPVHHFSVDERKSWANGRHTTILEDKVYCLIGIFGVSMGSRYGEGLEKALERLEGKIRKLNDRHSTGQELRLVLQWLSPPDPSSNYGRALKQRQAGTGQWLLNDERYLDWKAGERQALWLCGIPGCGKTVLTSTVLEDVLSFAEQSTENIVLYYFFSFTDTEKRVADLMLRSLLAQLIRKCAKVPKALLDLFHSCDNGQRQPPLDAYLSVLKQVFGEITRIYIILDALDECEQRRELMDSIHTVFGWRLPNVKVLLTSRKEHDIEDVLLRLMDNEAIVQLQSKRVDPDIRTYIVERLEKDRALEKWRKDSHIREEIENILVTKADGMFRWAACQLDALAKCRSRAQLRQALSTLPTTLDETYERILCAISPGDTEYAIRLLRWLAFSVRPLLIEELAEAIAIDPTREDAFDKDEVLEDPMEVVQICSSLVRVDECTMNHCSVSHFLSTVDPSKNERYVLLAHYSVKEYLTSERCTRGKASPYAMKETLSHVLLSECCLGLLSSTTIYPESDDVSQRQMYIYSCQYWVEHGMKGPRSERWMGCAMQFCLNQTVQTLWEQEHHRLHPRRAENRDSHPRPELGLYSASLTGFTDLVSRLLDRNIFDINTECGSYGYALMAATARGYDAIVDTLLHAGADPNVVFDAPDGPQFRTALITASFEGYTGIVKALLHAGAKVDTTNWDGTTALQLATEEGHLETVHALLHAGADVNRVHGFFGNALRIASIHGREAIVDALTHAGADANSSNGSHGNALQAASAWGYDFIVRILLHAGADVNAVGASIGHAVAVTVSGNGMEIISHLTFAGADVTSADITGADDFLPKVLTKTICRGNERMVDFVFRMGARNPAVFMKLRVALLEAIKSQVEGVVDTLLRAGADVLIRGERDYSLLYTAQWSIPSIVRLFLRAGADLDAEDDWAHIHIKERLRIDAGDTMKEVKTTPSSQELD